MVFRWNQPAWASLHQSGIRQPGVPSNASGPYMVWASSWARMLRMLQGRSHEVYTGICLKRAADGFERTAHEVTEVRFLPMSEEEISSYVRTGEPLDKAGAYAIQGFGTLFISGITGDYFNVVGLPVRLVATMLKEAGMEVI